MRLARKRGKAFYLHWLSLQLWSLSPGLHMETWVDNGSSWADDHLLTASGSNSSERLSLQINPSHGKLNSGFFLLSVLRLTISGFRLSPSFLGNWSL